VNDNRSSSTPTLTGELAGEGPLRDVRHDLRHSLYVLGLAMNVLEDSRTDAARFAEVIQMVRKEQVTIERLANQVLDFAAGNRNDWEAQLRLSAAETAVPPRAPR
jgi:signal transduction histidine kinase